MSNKLKKKITCCLCDRTVPYTNECNKLLERDVCPDCSVRLVKVVERILAEHDEVEDKESEISER